MQRVFDVKRTIRHPLFRFIPISFAHGQTCGHAGEKPYEMGGIVDHRGNGSKEKLEAFHRPKRPCGVADMLRQFVPPSEKHGGYHSKNSEHRAARPDRRGSVQIERPDSGDRSERHEKRQGFRRSVQPVRNERERIEEQHVPADMFEASVQEHTGEYADVVVLVAPV